MLGHLTRLYALAVALTSVGHVTFDEVALRAFCEKWKITELAVFGSALRDDFRPDSDVDLLARFAPNSGTTLFDLGTWRMSWRRCLDDT